MKALLAAFGVLMAGLLLTRGLSTPQADGQSPTPAVGLAGYGPEPGTMPGWAGHNNQNASAQLAQQYAKASKEDEKKELRQKLADSLHKEFDQLAQKQQADLDELEKQVASLKTVLKKRKESKESIVERRIEQLIQEAEGLGWGSSTHPNLYDPSSTPSAAPAPRLPRP
jgi:hypothetical protein